ncbi:MAG: Com family DNA-binding transcriptional regulator [Gammaproteobacteria bacterium]|nr:Com family DNA-binding transcriptional regulator [Gammaproteobacteria bacterium]MBU1505925.1 Com family DNA-binding transcriptional regulator [Gammaproteobacteria bacterium]MBU2119853.1 Com family DNA-binding transcriptional regulator [Gammaproteobacteria bacterium]MBU2189769.1 Com family DNA-binding transcriptional regulator [Gammaproteobacteria bacterium]
MNEVRCGSCHRLLARAVFQCLEIKCPRCGTLNNVRAASPQPERLGASNKTDHDSKQRNRSTNHPSLPPDRQRHHLPGRQHAADAAAGPAG